ncbi:hypothetical protein PHK61_31060 [Actinomycetospora lutea]|uniref:hypothetical protein n=1 Tax=Actinomycetospora lutea TaxID=663604 RepID=UPI002365D8D2|nr:hypothetical protein [Actinomycetospora lutea]MDD7942861.1 hypothetical protein [Actinomycetospora lutea]
MIERLRELAPQRLFVAADGPRPDVPGDAERCAEARAALDGIDWPTELRTRFQGHNLGCKVGPETAISWFFDEVELGIVLEDDCVPEPEFFPFCAELLTRYRDADEVMMISGHNAAGALDGVSSSYVVSRTAPTWGWATWRRAWQHHDPEMAAWDSADVRAELSRRLPATEYRLTRRRFDLVRTGRLDAWDFAWAFAMLRRDGRSLIATRSIVTNTGFGADATHTRTAWASAQGRVDADRPAAELLPLRHPSTPEPSAAVEAAIFRARFPLSRQIMTLLPAGVSRAARDIVHRTSRFLPQPAREHSEAP